MTLGWRFAFRAAALLALLAAPAIPSITIARPVHDVIAVLDITGSMNARDQTLDGIPVSRIAIEKRATRRLLAGLPCGSRLGLAVFVESKPFLLFEPTEICAGFTPLDREITAIDWRMGWDSESHIAEALRAAILMAAALRADLVFMTDGQETPPLDWSTPVDLRGVANHAAGLIVGIGGHTLVPIPKFDAMGRQIGTFRPGDVPSEKSGIFRGHEHLSAVDEPHLQSLAAATGLTYTHLDTQDSLLPAIMAATRPRLQNTATQLHWMAASVALVLLAASLV